MQSFALSPLADYRRTYKPAISPNDENVAIVLLVHPIHKANLRINLKVQTRREVINNLTVVNITLKAKVVIGVRSKVRVFLVKTRIFLKDFRV